MPGGTGRFRVVAQAMDWGGPEAENEALAGLDVDFEVRDFGNDEDAVIQAARGAHGLILGSGWATRRVIHALAPDLKVISRYGVGYDRVDLQAATDHGVVVANVRTGGVFNQEMSNHAILLLLACAKKLMPLNRIGHTANWRERTRYTRPMVQIYDQVLGIIGLGDIGAMTARKARAFDLTVLAYDPFATPEKAAECGAELVDLDQLLRQSDFVSIHCPLTPETENLIGEREFGLMKPTAYLINTARGPIVNEPALIRALQEGRIAGAGLDVLEKEPPDPDNPLLGMENVIITPHCAGISDRGTFNVKKKAAENVARVLTGRWPESVVNPDVKQVLGLQP
ncbi:MAG: C-terminal binding protein [Anaerolineae bacterium]|nr:C-terminal binding protein [Anaerolineae bacterium]